MLTKTILVNLQELDLSYNHIGAQGAEKLALNTSWSKLHTLYLNNNQIGEQGKNVLKLRFGNIKYEF